MGIGWTKNKVQVKEIIEENSFYDIIKTIENKLFYKTKIEAINQKEANFIEKIIDVFRNESNKFDEKLLEDIVFDYCKQKNVVLEKNRKEKLIKNIIMEIKGFSVLEIFLRDIDLEEIAVLNNKQPIYVYHKKYGWLETDIIINNSKKIKDIINKISRSLGRRITLRKPKINANLKFGRMHAAIPPIAFSGPCITIRRFNPKPFSPNDLVKNKTISSEAMAFLWMAVQCDINVLIAGNTGSGKTSTLNSLFYFIPQNERIIIVEETPEIFLPHKHQIRLNVSPELDIKMHELVTDTLRMRPDRIIVGEVRDSDEIKSLINTMLAGQGKSSFATFHAQNSHEALIRMMSLGINSIDLHALDLIIIQRRWTKYNGNKQTNLRRITEISSIKKNYQGEPEIETIFEYNYRKDTLEKNDLFNNHIFEKICISFNLNRKKFDIELKKRKKMLEGNDVSNQ